MISAARPLIQSRYTNRFDLIATNLENLTAGIY
jgi:hypothetical protein